MSNPAARQRGRNRRYPKQEITKALKLERLRTQEIKHHFVAISSASIGWGGTLVLLNDPATGNTDSTRIGNQIFQKSLVARLRVVPTSFYDYVEYRIICFKWIPDTTPTPSMIVHHSGTADATLTLFNHNYKTSYKILYDSGMRTCQLCFTSPSGPHLGNNAVIPYHQIILKLNGQRQQFESTGSTNSDQRIYFLFLHNTSTTTNFAIQGRSEFKYYDA